MRGCDSIAHNSGDIKERRQAAPQRRPAVALLHGSQSPILSRIRCSFLPCGLVIGAFFTAL